MEVDQVAVNKQLWDSAKSATSQHDEAVEKLRMSVNGLVLYEHCMPVAADEIVVTLRELQEVCYDVIVRLGFESAPDDRLSDSA